MGKRLVEVPHLDSTFERPHKHFLVRWDDPDGGLVNSEKIFPHWFLQTLSYVVQVCGGHLPMMAYLEMVYNFIYQLLTDEDGSTCQTHVPSQGGNPNSVRQ